MVIYHVRMGRKTLHISYNVHVDKGRAHPTTEDPPGRGLRGVGCEDMCVFS